MAHNDGISYLSPSVRSRIIYILMALATGVGCYIFLYFGIKVGTLFYLMPMLVLFAILCFSYPLVCFFLLYATTYFIAGMGRYITLPLATGLFVDILILVNILILLLQYMAGNKVGKLYLTPFLILSVGWLLFCFMQIVNPMSSMSNWSTTVRSIGIHIVLFQVLVSCVLDSPARLRYFFYFWGTLVLFAALKAIGQKHIGFDSAEAAWIYTSGAHTHVIYSGIRYFSFFTDAANFGCHMGLALVVFTILFLYDKSVKRRIFFGLIVVLATYGMLISGTRAAIAVPFVGFTCFVLLLKEWKWIIAGGCLLLLLFAFFNYTTIGNSNADIRRMRTAFNFAEDASFNVRLENQKKMRAFMHNHPFGIGLGSSKHSLEGDKIHGIATDSSFVFIWVETGIVGLVFYVLLCLSILGFGTYYVLVRIGDVAIKGIVMASTAGLAGMMVAGYANEVLHQMPTGQTVYILMGIVMLAPHIERKAHYADNIDL